MKTALRIPYRNKSGLGKLLTVTGPVYTSYNGSKQSQASMDAGVTRA